MSPPVQLNDYVDVVCLPEQNQPVPVGQECYAAGWGALTEGGGGPAKLNEVPLEIFNDSVCHAYPESYGSSFIPEFEVSTFFNFSIYEENISRKKTNNTS